MSVSVTLMKMLSTERSIVMVLMLSNALQVFSWCAGLPDQTDFMVMHQRMSKMIRPMVINNN